MKIKLELTDEQSLNKASREFRNEAERLLGWAKIFRERNGDKQYDLYLHRCRRLNRIANELKVLADSYQELSACPRRKKKIGNTIFSIIPPI